MIENFNEKLSNIIDKEKVERDKKLKDYTTLHIGGGADFLVTPTTIEEIKNVIRLCKEENMPYYILGNGSNILVSDKGYRGVIIRLSKNYGRVSIGEDGFVVAQAGILLTKLSKRVAEKSLTGFEFAEGIPGTLGGAVTMNAGAYGGEIKDNIVYAKVMNTDGNIFKLNKDELKLGYRTSILQRKNYILLEAGFRFQSGDYGLIHQSMSEFNQARRDKQPLEKFSAGSAFKRPVGYYAGKLISDSGLRGYRIGDIAVSKKHCGFIVNHGNGTAKEFVDVVNHIVKTVEDKYGVTLESEVRLLGDF